MKINNRTLTKSALSGSILILLLWLLLGTTTTVTWFTDQDEAVNSFVYGNVDVKVEYKKDSSSDWDVVLKGTNLFNDEALYEPGYTQVVRLKVSNEGTVPFDYRLAVNVNSFNYGDELYCLPDHLRFGVVFADTENQLEQLISSRELAKRIETEEMGLYKLNTYYAVDGNGKSGTLGPEDTKFAALVVTMPTSVGNEANYHGGEAPYVDLGITVLASQLNTIQNID